MILWEHYLTLVPVKNAELNILSEDTMMDPPHNYSTCLCMQKKHKVGGPGPHTNSDTHRLPS